MSTTNSLESIRTNSFLCGMIAGISSASLTHCFDVGKVLKQTQSIYTPISTYGLKHVAINAPFNSVASQSRPFHVSNILRSFTIHPPSIPMKSHMINFNLIKQWYRGVTFGALAQGTRFGLMIMLKNSETKSSTQIPSFLRSMAIAGISEIVANPFVTVKNRQIVTKSAPKNALVGLYREGPILSSFFRGIGVGVLRKSLANAIVLEAMSNVNMGVGYSFIYGGLIGGFAEVLTNPPDRVKTILQTNKGISLLSATKIALKDPFAGAGYAFVRKGVIRAVNWAILAAILIK